MWLRLACPTHGVRPKLPFPLSSAGHVRPRLSAGQGTHTARSVRYSRRESPAISLKLEGAQTTSRDPRLPLPCSTRPKARSRSGCVNSVTSSCTGSLDSPRARDRSRKGPWLTAYLVGGRWARNSPPPTRLSSADYGTVISGSQCAGPTTAHASTHCSVVHRPESSHTLT